jgi:serine acetyltransferase
MKLRNIFLVIRIAGHRIYWCVKKGFPLRMALCDIPFEDIPASTRFNHPYGITIGKGTILGERCIFASNVTIGTRRPFFGEPQENPAMIGNDVFFGAGCVILGGVVLSDKTIIGSNKVIKG